MKAKTLRLDELAKNGFRIGERRHSSAGSERLICNQQVVGSNPTAGSLDNQALTPILATQRKSVFAMCLPLLRRKVRSL